MPRQADHGTCLELMQNRPLTRAIYLTHNRVLQKPAATISTAKEETTQQNLLTVPYENRMEEVHIYRREKYLNLTKELEDAGYEG